MKRWRFALCIGIAAALLILDVWAPPLLAVWMLQVVLVWTAARRTTHRELIVLGSICGLCIVLGWAAAARNGSDLWILAFNCLLGDLAILLLVLVHFKGTRAEEAYIQATVELEQFRSHVTTLTGLLPICSSCKKIRNKEGEWEQLEVYIGGHLKASFTHDVCPECMERLYPGAIPLTNG